MNLPIGSDWSILEFWGYIGSGLAIKSLMDMTIVKTTNKKEVVRMSLEDLMYTCGLLKLERRANATGRA